MAFNNLYIKGLPIPDSGQKVYIAPTTPGFGVRVSYNGTKSFTVQYRVKGHSKRRRATIGIVGDIKLADARERAQEIKKHARQGVDLLAEERRLEEEAQIAEARRDEDSIESVCELFIERYAKKNTKYWHQTKAIFDTCVLPKWRDRPIGSIQRRDVVDLLDWIEDRSGIYRANRTLAAIRKMFNWAMIERAIIESTPIIPGMSRGKETKRDRVLTDQELKAIWEATDKTGYPYGNMDKLLILTGQRVGEVSKMQWEDIDFDNRVWTLPAEETKANRRHEVPLSDLALEIIEATPCTGEYLFTSGRIGDKPINGQSKSKAVLDEKSGVAGWRRHDYRRTMATNISRLHFTRFVIERVLNHADNSVTAVYDHGSYLDEKRDALDAWADKLQLIVNPPDDSNVVELRG